ncbi:Proteasome subunit alpha type [Meloidogyne graminicola]|uniref:Proteasome subunit alpha type n=1 Tax=Meloidogyne graminicola TaxID=189291 RepID=A0A8T0A0H2_9BILA|nr:Proteasome subunit alpha type [Meloidogyne graminicola]
MSEKGSEKYSFSLTTFSPSGKLMQIEYAMNAVKGGSPSVGIKAKECVVLASENKSSLLQDSDWKIEKITSHIGCAHSGMGPDSRILVRKARKIATEYKAYYGEPMPITQLSAKVASIMQEYTQSGGVRPFGVSLLIGGWDESKGPMLFQIDPSGSYFAWRATAIGKNDNMQKPFLEKRYDPKNNDLSNVDAIHIALLTLRESYDVGMTEDNVELVICTQQEGFKRLTKQELKEHLQNL